MSFPRSTWNAASLFSEWGLYTSLPFSNIIVETFLHLTWVSPPDMDICTSFPISLPPNISCLMALICEAVLFSISMAKSIALPAVSVSCECIILYSECSLSTYFSSSRSVSWKYLNLSSGVSPLRRSCFFADSSSNISVLIAMLLSEEYI